MGPKPEPKAVCSVCGKTLPASGICANMNYKDPKTKEITVCPLAGSVQVPPTEIKDETTMAKGLRLMKEKK
jgi:hypothetical protein